MQISQVQNPTMNYSNPNFQGLKTYLTRRRIESSLKRCEENPTIGKIKDNLLDNSVKHFKKFLTFGGIATLLYVAQEYMMSVENLINIICKIAKYTTGIISALHAGVCYSDLVSKSFLEQFSDNEKITDDLINKIFDEDENINIENTETKN